MTAVPGTVRRRVAANGVALDVAVRGEGPAVVLCHGFPELAYSWRHQIPVLAAAGHRVLAPDMRGYGGSSAPRSVEAYDVLTLCEDLVGLLDAEELHDAVFVGHDWGASVVWQLALAHPDRVRAVAALSVPFAPRAPVAPMSILRRRLGEDFYMAWFQGPGEADAALARDVRRTIITPEALTAAWAERGDVPERPRWLTEEDVAVYAEAFERTGFTGGLNYYRNIDRNWELTAAFDGRRVPHPALFLTGADDPVRRFMAEEPMLAWVPRLRDSIVIERAGHRVQQERPEEVNAALLRFLGGL